MPLNTTQRSALAWLVITLALLAALWLLAPVLTPFMVAAVLAYILTPVVDWLDARIGSVLPGLPRVLLVLAVELAFLALALGLVLLMVPILAHELPQLREQMPLLLERLHQSLQPVLAQWGVSGSLDPSKLRPALLAYLNANLDDAARSLLSSLKLGGSVAFALLGNAILIPVALFYLLLDWKRLQQQLQELVPAGLRDSTFSFLYEADTVLGQYLRGQLLVMVILAAYYSLALSLFGLDLALPIGIFTGLAMFVPYVGFGLGLLLATLAGFLEFAVSAGPAYPLMMIAVVYGLGQLLESFYLTPRLVGERIGLHPLMVIFALLAFGQLFGFVGVLVALPASAVLLVAARRARRSYLDSRLYRG